MIIRMFALEFLFGKIRYVISIFDSSAAAELMKY